MKTYFTLVLFFCFLNFSNAQFSYQEWHNGIVITTDNDTIQGEIQYNFETNTITLSKDENVRAFSSYKVVYFEIFDKILQSYRQFYTIPYKLKTEYETPVIFELLYEGPLSLLARERVVQETASFGNYGVQGPRVVQDVVNYQYYFLHKDGSIEIYLETKTDLYRIMSDKKSDIKVYIKENKLKHDMLRDLIRITSFYNSI